MNFVARSLDDDDATAVTVCVTSVVLRAVGSLSRSLTNTVAVQSISSLAAQLSESAYGL